MELHHSKHHQTYVNNLNNALTTRLDAVTTHKIRKELDSHPVIKFNAGGHINHSLFWENLAPAKSGKSKIAEVAPQLNDKLSDKYGSVAKFKEEFKALLLSIQGSGWGWLVADPKNGLEILQTKDQDVVPSG